MLDGRGAAGGARLEEFRARGVWGDASLLDHWALSVTSSPLKEAVVDARGRRSTYGQVDADSDRLAGYLRGCGVGIGDVVATQLPNWSEYLTVVVACWKIGAVVVPVVTTLRHADLAEVLERAGASVLVEPVCFRSADFVELARTVRRRLCGPGLVIMVGDELPADSAQDLELLSELVSRAQPLPAQARTPGRGADVAAVLFTSGSEARPKGVVLSHDNIIASERSFAHALRIGHCDRMFMPAPIGHATGFLHGLVMPVMTDATSVLLDVFDGHRALAMLNRESCTCGMAPATIVSAIVDACEDEGTALCDSLRFLCCGGSPVPRQLLARVRRHGTRLYSVYGSTESAPHTLTMCLDDDERVLTTDGRAVADVQVKVVDPQTRQEVAAEVEGEEASRGPNVFLGYLGDPELTSSVLDADGWYYSGDLCVMDAEGYIRITGRLKDVIIRGGENISPVEVEEVVRDHPGVCDVAVVAMPDPVMGERACAFVVMAPGQPAVTTDTLKRLFVRRGLAKYKIPERVEIVAALPFTDSGKVRKPELRAKIRQLLEDESRGAASVAARAEVTS
jgi:acyl-CoA synthetase